MSLLEASTLDHAPSDANLLLPGDEFLPEARVRVTHHVDIQAPPTEVWPWLVQMGRRRGGWYSWDLLDNGGEPSAERILPEFQELALGDVLPIKASGSDGFTVLELEPPRALVIGDPSLLFGRQAPKTSLRGTWSFWLEPSGRRATHLVTRLRLDYQPSFKMAALLPILLGVHAFMQRKQLRTLKQRAEAFAGAPGSASPSGAEPDLNLKRLVGSGDRIGLLLMPFLVVGSILNVVSPALFSVGGPPPFLKLLSSVLLIPGVIGWLWSVALILKNVPRQRLITRGPYAIVKHPLYTSVALLVLPSAGFLLDSWLGALLGGVLYVGSRLFSPAEEDALARDFGAAWQAYRRQVKLPWL